MNLSVFRVVVLCVTALMMTFSGAYAGEKDQGKPSDRAGKAEVHEKYAEDFENKADLFEKRAAETTGKRAEMFKRRAHNYRLAAKDQRNKAEEARLEGKKPPRDERVKHADHDKPRKELHHQPKQYQKDRSKPTEGSGKHKPDASREQRIQALEKKMETLRLEIEQLKE